MKTPPKILWSEGLTVGPQQFQQQDHYHESRLHWMAQTLHAYPWGVRKIEWNLEGLANNSLQALSLSIIFADGEIYDAPGADELPLPVDLGKFPPSEQAITFYAALPLLREHGGNLSGKTFQRAARFAQFDRDTADLFTDAASIEIGFLHKTVHLVSNLEARESFDSLPVVRVRRCSSGGFEIDPAWMPPSVSVQAIGGLPLLLDNLITKLKAKIDALYGVHREPSKYAVEVNGGDIASFWMLHTLSAACASLQHFTRSRHQHPERLYVALLTLAGGLLAFSRKYTLADLPAYQHDAPGEGFAKLDGIIRDLVDTVISSKYFTIALSKEANSRANLNGRLDAAKVDRNTLLCLAIGAEMAALELVESVPNWFKVGSPDDVEKMLSAALPGVRLVHMPQIPAAIPVRPSTYYFALENKGDLYERMLKAQAIAIYAPATMRGLQVELLAVTS